ncbi:MAG: LysM peptidoglycan-binding domain-containing protein [Marinifilaceae bacterium]
MRGLHSIICCILFLIINTVAFAQEIKINKSSQQEIIGGNIFYIHTVKAGETLYSISKIYNIEASIIIECNHKDDISISVGEILNIPKDVYKDDRYFYHSLKEGETLYSIYKQTGVSTESILAHNSNIRNFNDISVGTYIKIPKDSVTNMAFSDGKNKELLETSLAIDSLRAKREPLYSSFIEQDEKTFIQIRRTNPDIIKKNINIALFIPFYLDINEAINGKFKENDTALYGKTIHKKSVNFINFYQGFIEACTALKEQGFKITLKTFDTAKDSTIVQNTINNLDFTQYDFVVGPPYASNFRIAANKAMAENTPIISPLSESTSTLLDNPYVYQLNTSEKTILQKTADYIYNRFNKANIIVVYPKGYRETSESELITHLENSLFPKENYLDKVDRMYTKISFDKYKLYGVRHVLKKGIKNVIIVPSKNKANIYKIIPSINALTDSYDISLMGLHSWKRFSSLDPSTFFKLNTTMLLPYYVDYKDENTNTFIKHYRKKYMSEPSSFTFRAYDLANYFVQAAARGNLNNITYKYTNYELLQSCFKFEEEDHVIGKENIGLHILHYNKDYTITKE